MIYLGLAQKTTGSKINKTRGYPISLYLFQPATKQILVILIIPRLGGG